METQAVVWTEAEQARLQEIDMPSPRAGEVQIRTAFSTISAGTEGWGFRNLFTWQPAPFPCVPGYQRTGVIVAVGPAVERWRCGDRVMATNGVWPGNVKPFWGAHIAVANTLASELYAIPPGVDDLDASATVVAQVGYNAASRAVIDPGDWAVVYGDGLIGQCAAQAIRARGARVVLAGHRRDRLECAAAWGADSVVDSHDKDVVAQIRRLTGSETVAVVLDSVQTGEAQRQYLPLLERGQGQIVYCGFTPGTTWADMALLQQHELTTHFVSGWTRARMEATLALMAKGKLRVGPLVTHLAPAVRGPEMYRMIREKSAPFLGITLDWREERA